MSVDWRMILLVNEHRDIPDEVDAADWRKSPLRENAGIASLAHWSFLMSFVVPVAMLVLPLVLINTTGKRDPFVNESAKEALNFLVSFLIVFLACVVSFVGILLLPLLYLAVLVFSIIAACETMSCTEDMPVYRYPLIVRLIK